MTGLSGIANDMRVGEWQGNAVRDWALITLAEEEAKRQQKRRNAIALAKQTTLYSISYELDSASADALQPDPEDTTISKRAWERAFKRWRDALRTLAAESQR